MSESAKYSKAEIAEVVAGLHRLLEAVKGGQLVANVGLVARLEGAQAALQALAGGSDPLDADIE